MTDGPSLFERARREVIDRHADFVALGRGDRPGAAFDFARVMPPAFSLVTPEGEVLEQPGILAHLDDLERLGDPGFSIRIEEVALRWEGAGGVLLTYVEAQRRKGEVTRRRSTAFFTPDDAAPNGVVWRHLQETWM